MSHTDCSNDFEYWINTAKNQLVASDNTMIPPYTRLKIIQGVMGGDSYSYEHWISKNVDRIPNINIEDKGFKRFCYLNLLTAFKTLPVYYRESARYLSMYSGMEEIDLLPTAFLKGIKSLLEGKEEHEINFHEASGPFANWSIILGNLSEEFVYPHEMSLTAIYQLYLLVKGFVPFPSVRYFKQGATDYDSPWHRVHDVTLYASEAYSSIDLNEPGWEKPRKIPVQYDKVKSKEFWEWWLLDAVNRAINLDSDKLDWEALFAPHLKE